MAGETGFWSRMSEEFRSVSGRTRASARRAVSIGVLQVDLVSLRRDRSRALSDMGARALALWDGGTPHALESDAEALRLRTWIAGLANKVPSQAPANSAAAVRSGHFPQRQAQSASKRSRGRKACSYNHVSIGEAYRSPMPIRNC